MSLIVPVHQCYLPEIARYCSWKCTKGGEFKIFIWYHHQLLRKCSTKMCKSQIIASCNCIQSDASYMHKAKLFWMYASCMCMTLTCLWRHSHPAKSAFTQSGVYIREQVHIHVCRVSVFRHTHKLQVFFFTALRKWLFNWKCLSSAIKLIGFHKIMSIQFTCDGLTLGSVSVKR